MFASLKPAMLTLCLGALAIGVGCSRAPDDRQIATEVRCQIKQNSAIHGEVQAESAHGTVTLSLTAALRQFFLRGLIRQTRK